MSSTKTTLIYALEALAEASYGAGGTFTPATDAVLLAERAVMQSQYLYDGKRSNANGTAGTLPNVAPSGQYFEAPIKVECRGKGAVYSASAFPKDLHVLMRASGFDATGAFGAGTEKWTYTPESGTFESAALRMYAEGQQYDATGVYADMSFDIDGPGFGIFTFDCKGKISNPVDAAVIGTIAYDTVVPPKAEAITLSLNGVTTLKVRKVGFKQNRGLTQRADINQAGAFAGYSPGRRDPTLDITVEAEALATLNPWSLWTAGTQFLTSFQVGSAQYNRMKFNAPQSQIVGVEVADEDNIVLWNLKLKLPTGGQQVNNDFTVVFD